MSILNREIKNLSLINIGHSYSYELRNICRIFFPLASVLELEGEDSLVAEITETKAIITLTISDFKESRDCYIKNNAELAISKLLFITLSELTGYKPDWGMLTGIRPVKLIHKAMEEGLTDEEIVRYFDNVFCASEEMIKLSIDIAKKESKIKALSKSNSFSLYIGVPFCPTKCSYCSFVSGAVSSFGKYIDPYVEKLVEELKYIGDIAKNLNLRLETIYFGGGTPTTLSASQLKKVLSAVNNNFDLTTLREFTVEAGRPDSIDEEKLRVIKSFNIRRISINPQTLSDDILKSVGRTHTGEDVINTFNLAREVGFDCINMDLIAGLPGESFESFKHSLDTVYKLSPENITVHTLTIKRASDIYQNSDSIEESVEEITTKMVKYAREKLLAQNYSPYYLYRQKNTVANLENIGYSIPNEECLYNIYIMDETHSIFSAGAGGVTKLRKGNDIKRIHNFKHPHEYIDRFDELLKRKDEIASFLE